MEEKEEVKTGKVIGIIVIIVAVLAIIGGVCWYIYVEKKNNNAAAQNTVNEVNAEANTDPYANYKDIEWSRNKSQTNISDWLNDDLSISIDNEGIININNAKESVKINSLIEKAKYFELTIDDGVRNMHDIVCLTENNNLYVIEGLYNDGLHNDDGSGSLRNDPYVQKVASNILEIYRDTTNASIPYIRYEDSGGTFVGVYALTSDGELLSINLDHNPYTGENKFVLGLSYEECNFVKQRLDGGGTTLQLTNDNYLRDESSITANYIVDSNNNKLSVKYWFAVDNEAGSTGYVVTLEGNIYFIKHDIDTGNNNVKLLNNKVVKNMGYNNYVVTVMYTDNTIDTFNIEDTYQKYGF